MLWGVAWLYYHNIAYENHVLEYLQVLFLLIGSLIFFYLSIVIKENSYYVLYLSLGVFYLTFLVRELEPDRVESFYATIILPPVRNYWIIAAWIFVLFIFLRKPRSTVDVFLEWVKLEQGVCIIVGGLWYLLGDIFDKNLLDLNRPVTLFIEELLELNGTIFMLLSAIISLVWSMRQEWWSDAYHDSIGRRNNPTTVLTSSASTTRKMREKR